MKNSSPAGSLSLTLSPEPPEGVEWLPVFRAEAAEGMTAALI